ncbi:hypothetical protein O181_006213 [Austropuccinia psidii MF-1]|uniref:Uncharacterized protein n=1 Tax=Austropuccinia psidii MF-1 TaxID=1389203 RepID=A0A9Q3BK15_9BASI|nr:hypothetical protein [Austropuccinia psidii MF-1]
MKKMPSTPTADHLPPFPCLLSCMNWLLHFLLIISAADHVYNCSNIGFHPTTSASPLYTILMLLYQHLIISATSDSWAPTPPSHVLNLTTFPSHRNLLPLNFLIISTVYHPYASAPLPHHLCSLPCFCSRAAL